MSLKIDESIYTRTNLIHFPSLFVSVHEKDQVREDEEKEGNVEEGSVTFYF